MLSNAFANVTRKWLEKWVIGYNFCPFAHYPHSVDRVGYIVYESRKLDGLPAVVLEACHTLVQEDDSPFDTTLIICPHLFETFLEYWDYSGYLEDILDAEGFAGKIQIATFHPNYVFEGEPDDAISNYTNRSPFPVLHLIRENDVARARLQHEDTAKIPMRNIKFLENQPINEWDQQLKEWRMSAMGKI